MPKIKDEKVVANFERKPKVGKTYYRFNKKTKELEEYKIIGVKYVFDKKIGSKNTFTEDEIDWKIKDGELSDDFNSVKLKEIKKLEEQFGIKLKEV